MFSSTLKKILIIIDLVALICILIFSINRDIQLEKQYPGDLRNRVVGARLQQDGKSPYFYKWKREDGYRYLDPQNSDSLKVSNITASPFFHDLLFPVCNLSQRTISLIQFCLQYVMLIVITVAFICLSKNILSRWAILNTSVIFTCTQAWKMLIADGQMYLFVAFGMTAFIFGILQDKKSFRLWIASLAAVILVLIRPIAFVIFIPYVLIFEKSKKFVITSAAIFVLYSVFVLFSRHEKEYWMDYYHALKEEVKLHQDDHPTTQLNEKVPKPASLEGFNFYEVSKNQQEHPITVYSENGNFFVLFEKLTHKKISVRSLTLLWIAATVILCLLMYIKRNQMEQWQIALFCLLLYMLAELLSPIHRHQYNTIQWLPMLLLSCTFIEFIPRWLIACLIVGLILNIFNFTFLLMRHTLGEYVWLISLFLIGFRKQMNKPAWKLQ